MTFPTLSRPQVKPNEDPTEDLARWGANMYAYSLIAQLRKILSALVQIANAENIPAANILGRHVFELAAHACYMNRKLTDYFSAREWRGAWDVLTTSAVGNLWVKRHGGKYAPPSTQPPLVVPNPVRIGDAISEYELYQSQEYGQGDAKDDYGLLSELSHPNAACFQQHYIYATNGRDVEIGDADPISPLPFLKPCLIDILHFTIALLKLSKETTVCTQLEAILVELVNRAHATRA